MQLYNLELQKRLQYGLVSRADLSLPFYHPSHEAVIYAPFSLLSYRAAYSLFICFNMRHLPATRSFNVVTTVSLALLVLCLYLVRRQPREASAFSISILCGLLVRYHLCIHDMALLLIPLALLSGTVSSRIVSACYGLPPLVLVGIGANGFFLLALPMLALLAAMTRPGFRQNSLVQPGSLPSGIRAEA